MKDIEKSAIINELREIRNEIKRNPPLRRVAGEATNIKTDKKMPAQGWSALGGNNNQAPENWKIQFFSACVVAVFLAILLLASSGPAPRGETETQLYGDDSALQSEIPYSYLEEVFSQTQNSTQQTQDEMPAGPGSRPAPSPSPLPKSSSPLVSGKIEVASPKLFDVMALDENFSIRWQVLGEIGTIHLKIYEAAVSYCGYDQSCLSQVSSLVKSFTIGKLQGEAMALDWRVGQIPGQSEKLSPGQYFLRLETPIGQVLGESQTFAVVGKRNIATIDVAVPYNENDLSYETDTFTYSKQYDIAQAVLWNSTPSIFFVDIFIRAKSCSSSCVLGSGLYKIADRTPNGNLFAWDPSDGDAAGADIPTGEYELYIQDTDRGQVKSATKHFILE